MARSKNTARLGHVSLETAKNDAWRPSVRAAQRERKYKPAAEAPADKRMTTMPSKRPTEARAAG